MTRHETQPRPGLEREPGPDPEPGTGRDPEAGTVRGPADGDSPSSRAAGPDQHELDREAEELSAVVMDASRLFVAISARALASAAETLTLAQLRALVVLDTCGPVRLTALAATLGVNPSTALRMAERLTAVGLVDRRANPANRREVLLSLTGAGGDLVTTVLARRRAEIRTLVERLPAEERAALVPALRALTAAAGEMAVEADPVTPTAADVV